MIPVGSPQMHKWVPDQRMAEILVAGGYDVNRLQGDDKYDGSWRAPRCLGTVSGLLQRSIRRPNREADGLRRHALRRARSRREPAQQRQQRRLHAE